MTMKVMYHTFGCKLNFAETSSVALEFERRGCRRVAPGETPDIIVVNTCSVTALADKKCRQAIRAFHRRYPQAHIIATGCYAQLNADEALGLPGVSVVAGSDRKDQLAELLDSIMPGHKGINAVTPAKDIRRFVPSCARGERTRYFLKVQDGCDNWCSYCTIPAARGRSRSATVAQLVAQARQAAADGGREIVLTGVNIGDFGKRSDAATPETFLDLIKALDQVEGIDRYRISSIEPDLLTDGIIDFCASSRAFMPHFHIPLQSGSDAVLKLMRRRYDTALFRDKIERIVASMPNAFIGIDLITGSRGETADEFERSRRFIESLPITRLHVFPYSERPGTRALEIPHIVDPQERRRRTECMIALSAEKMTAYARRYVGTVRPVLLESPDSSGMMTGHTDNYLKVRLDAPAAMENEIVAVKLTSIENHGTEDPVMLGEITQP
ncbi:MAG: tRNA (N(6)-L-threonylcarbamoyladenosine(37)-C(2))-methylthiotransferase MtaB [Muribaculaceae bacterium]|nr:tRNA (N(6)-L-threonylcarbamoyladenosine(37)-C(2))-methylthiotransferase MtaB [Muribaculaceae bacterium]